jgi:CheY-like chemotaxis protein
MHVLFVDDDIEDREFFLDALSYVDRDIICVLAKNCEHCLELLSQSKTLPDYIFLDIQMPRMDGKACLALIKNNEKYKNIKVVMYSGSSDQKLMQAYKNEGASYFLIKPATFKDLCASLSVLFDK